MEELEAWVKVLAASATVESKMPSFSGGSSVEPVPGFGRAIGIPSELCLEFSALKHKRGQGVEVEL